MPEKPEKFDIYKVVTDKFIEALEKGKIPWKKPYSGVEPYNFVTKRSYTGINNLMLNLLDYKIPAYLTFKQIQKLGGRVKKGEHSTIVVFWKWIEVKDKNSLDPDDDKKVIPFLRYFRVFNIEQTTGIEYDKKEAVQNVLNPIEEAESIIVNSRTPDIQFGASRIPCYIPSSDEIKLPKKEAFNSSEELYSTIFHEMCHATGHKSRLNRQEVMNKRGLMDKSSYSKEELVAEIGASFLNHICGFGDKEQENSEAYINGWISVLKDHKRMIVEASGKAQKAVDYIMNKKEGE